MVMSVNIDYKELIKYHNTLNDFLTICTRKFEYEIPFGVLNLTWFKNQKCY